MARSMRRFASTASAWRFARVTCLMSSGWSSGGFPGGRYLQVRLCGEAPGVYDLIAPTFERLAKRVDADPSRPGIEFYRRRDVIDLLQPVS